MQNLVKHRWIKLLLSSILLLALLALTFAPDQIPMVLGQYPTGSIPTVTSSPRGAYIIVKLITTVEDPIKVRAGPSQLTEQVGLLLVYQEANATGRYGDWIQIEYPGGPNGRGWVFSNLVELVNGTGLPIIEPPPTSTPQTTKTIDPTLAAQFIITAQPTRLPTFTEPPPLQIPTFAVESSNIAPGGIPMGFIIIGLGGLGIFIGLIALLRRG